MPRTERELPASRRNDFQAGFAMVRCDPGCRGRPGRGPRAADDGSLRRTAFSDSTTPALVHDAMLATTEKHQDGLEFYQRLIEGDELACRKLVRRLQETEGASVVRICEALTEALHAIGDTWQCSQLEIYREHIASEIAYAMLLELWARLPEPESDAPLAVGDPRPKTTRTAYQP